MDLPQIISFTLVAIVLVVSPGANFALVTRSISTGGRSAALANIPGFAMAYLLLGALSVFGVAAVLAASPGLLIVLQLVGALYLLYLGVQSFSAAKTGLCVVENVVTSSGQTFKAVSDPYFQTGTTPSVFKGFADGFITNFLNPKNFLFYYAVFPQITAGTDNLVSTSFVLVIIHITVSVVWFSFLAVALSHLLQSSGSEKHMQLLRKSSGAVLIGFAAYCTLPLLLPMQSDGALHSKVTPNQEFSQNYWLV